MLDNLVTIKQIESYKNMLRIIGELSKLFNDGTKPFLYYRCHENIFCKYLDAENLAREDCSVDAKIGHLGIGLKTWVGSDLQKVAEFNNLRNRYDKLEGIELCKEVARLRNRRIQFTMDSHDLNEVTYHIVKRDKGVMNLMEHSFDMIDVDNIKLLENSRDGKNPKFTDGKHSYSFNNSKSTLFMYFDDLKLFDSINISINDDPFEILEKLDSTSNEAVFADNDIDYPQLCLKLYTTDRVTGQKVINRKSGLNQWNASGRKRDADELYIPYPSADRIRDPHFFPPRDENFNLTLPNGKVISAKVCQDGGKAIMSNPNKDLGHWILRDLLKVKEHEIVTMDTLEDCGIDSVVFTKIDSSNYKVHFGSIGTYENMYGNENSDDFEEEVENELF